MGASALDKQTGQPKDLFGTSLGYIRAEAIPNVAEDIAKTDATVVSMPGTGAGVYFTPQLLDQSILARSANFIKRPTIKDGELRQYVKGTKKEEVRARRYLLVDIDTTRAGGFQKDAATDAEKLAAWRVAGQVREFLDSQHWPAPLVVDSGNGFHLYYRLAEPQTEYNNSGTDPLAKLLRGLGRRFRGSWATVDTSLADPSQIMKLPGTRALKGPGTAERPHRRCWVVEVPDGWKPEPYTPATGQSRPATIAELIADLPPEPPITVATREAVKRVKLATRRGARPRPEDRAVAWMAKKPGAVDGNGGSTQTFLVALGLVRGFMLDTELAYQLMRDHYNPRCVGPWSEAQLRHKIDHAKKHPKRGQEDGWLLYAERARASSVSSPSVADLAPGVLVELSKPQPTTPAEAAAGAEQPAGKASDAEALST